MTFASSLDALVTRALEEDLVGGDITSDATVPDSAWAVAEAVAKSPLVVSGSELFTRSFYAVSRQCRVEQLMMDGQLAEPGQVIMRVEGPARALLKAERTALNFMQRLSGTASLTRQFVDEADGKIRIADTRKTTPGLRAAERQAVRDGGGHNHRDCLGSAIMIKDNHIAASGGITPAVTAAKAHAPHTSRIEVEVTNLEEVNEALSAGADILMLDNFEKADALKAISLAQGKAIIEVSGNMTLQRISDVREWGADVVSIGALTHSAPAADISLRLKPVTQDAPPLPSFE